MLWVSWTREPPHLTLVSSVRLQHHTQPHGRLRCGRGSGQVTRILQDSLLETFPSGFWDGHTSASSHFLTLLSLLSTWPPSGAEPSDCSSFSLGQACCPNLSQGLHTCSFLSLGHSSPFSSLLSLLFLVLVAEKLSFLRSLLSLEHVS